MQIKDRRVVLVVCLMFTLFLAWLDFLTGPLIQFPIFYLLPVVFVSWFYGLGWGMGFSLFTGFSRVLFSSIWEHPFTDGQIFINLAIRLLVFITIAVLVDQNAKKLREIKVLRGFLPICGFCKKIRGKDEKWVQLEQYISDRSEAVFSHGVCPDCARKNYPEVFSEEAK